MGEIIDAFTGLPYEEEPFFDPGIEALLDTIDNNDYLQFHLLIHQGVDVNGLYGSPKENSPLMYVAAGSGSPAMISLLIENGADVNYMSKSGTTALYCASEVRDLERAEMLLKAGANPNINDEHIPLHLVTGRGYHVPFLSMMELLLKYGADPNLTKHPHPSPLVLAMDKDDRIAVEMLLYAGADLNREAYPERLIKEMKKKFDITYDESIYKTKPIHDVNEYER